MLGHSVRSYSLRPHGLQPARLLGPWDSPGKNTGVGCHALLQGIFPTQEWNPGLMHGQVDSLPLSHQGSPKQYLSGLNSGPCQGECIQSTYIIQGLISVDCTLPFFFRFFFFFLVLALTGLGDLSSLTWDGTWAPGSDSTQS